MRKVVLYLVILLCGFTNAKAQNPQFSQFYAIPLFLNPAFTGLTFEHRFAADARTQWPGVATTYKTVAASYDYNLTSLSSGIGLMVMKDVAGTPSINSSLAMLSYAYHFNIGRNAEIRMGAQAGAGNKSIDASKLTFNDQLHYNAGTTADPYFINFNNQVTYLDINTGAMLNSLIYWFGISAQHINKPSTSFSLDGDNKQPVNISLHGGYRYILSKKRDRLLEYFSPCFNYKHELNFDQLDLGIYYVKVPLTFGLWYRGLPLKRYAPGYGNADAAVFLLGVDIASYNTRIGFTYDLTISRLTVSRSLGAFELSVIYEYARRNKKPKRILISCPKF